MSKWYLYEDDEVIGPFGEEQLRNRIDEETLVCEAGEENWQAAGNVPELESLFVDHAQQKQHQDVAQESEPSPATDDSARGSDRDGESTKTIEPTLEELQSICERANSDELMEQYEDHWDDYDAEERRVILAEIDNRGLMD